MHDEKKLPTSESSVCFGCSLKVTKKGARAGTITLDS